ncbi:hypothetical protein KIN20_030994 [Parelaphostrongylus tenuis]|uniref:Uncharacterized protein n=1 Tax=Parelaphostrongylus tenuis TaxID=148309 RepID=A0AAD5WGV4_PARTN|nr:hypothetical protein KIN20_030994 [Parelaphostrongylus tenuis]
MSTVLGCGVMPAGRMASRNFTVTGLTTLPVAMTYTGDSAVFARISGTAASKGAAQGFVSRLVMHTVSDVLESQGRSAVLADAVISAILDQLEIRVTYEPLSCQKVLDGPADMTEQRGNMSCFMRFKGFKRMQKSPT